MVDFELITLMAQDAPGLQLMFPPAGGSKHAGEWVELPANDGQCIVIVNDMLEQLRPDCAAYEVVTCIATDVSLSLVGSSMSTR